MKRWLGFILVLLMASRLPAAMPTPLDEAIKKWIADEDHWAYTQRVKYRTPFGGGVHNRVERFDPSQPDDQQWKLLFIDGKPPTSLEVASWKLLKKKEMARRERPLADYFDLDHATVAAETDDIIRYDVPLQKAKYRNVQLDKLAVTITVDRKTHTLANLDAGLREAFRVGLGMAKVTAVDLEIHFKSVDEQYAPQPEFIRANGSGRVAFLVNVGADADVTWSDFVRVTPYKARFEVKIGELRALGF